MGGGHLLRYFPLTHLLHLALRRFTCLDLRRQAGWTDISISAEPTGLSDTHLYSTSYV